MRMEKRGLATKIWLSANDTYNWANKTGNKWPCSQLSGKRLFAEFNGGDLVDITIDGKTGIDVDNNEFNAIIADLTELGKEK